MSTDHLPWTSTSLASMLDRWSEGSAEREPLVQVIRAIADAGARLSRIIAVAPLRPAAEGPLPAPADGRPPAQAAARAGTMAPTTNASGDEQKSLDVYAEKLFVDALAGLDVAAVCSEETADPIPVTAGGSLVLALDPVDGSSNIDVNAPIGTIFAILPTLGPRADPASALLQPGRRQRAAGMIVYGPSTMLVLTLGDGTDIYVLDPRTRDFRLVRERIDLPADSSEYAINASNARHWSLGIREYIADLVNGALGPRERDFNMRWLASLVAETYRILQRGGIFLYPSDARPGYEHGRIRLVYEANPIAFLCEQAGGAATDGASTILDLTPQDLHQRVPLVFGSRTKVERVSRYLDRPQTAPEQSPLFTHRGLFRS